jgi:hypothetical protein
MSDSSGGLAATVPELYYDLIGRVPPGLVFLGILLTSYYPLQVKDITAGALIALLFLGYTTGILVSGIGTWLATGLWHLSWRRAVKRNPMLRDQWNRYDGNLQRLFEHLCERNRNVLNKLTAEVMLCANLVVVFVLLTLAPGLRASRQQMIMGAAVSFVALCTRQYNATRRQTTLLLNETMESRPDLPL